MMASEMVERVMVAALMAASDHGIPIDMRQALTHGVPHLGIAPRAIEKMIRAAIKAMRECSGDMISAGAIAGDLPDRAAKEVWTDMIDAALEEGS